MFPASLGRADSLSLKLSEMFMRVSLPMAGLPTFLSIFARPCLGVVIPFLYLGGMGTARADDAQYFYDPAGRLTAMIDPVNGSAQYRYDSVGNILSVVRQPLNVTFVAQVSPTSSRVGVVVTIAGTGFGNTSNTTVSFNGQAAQPISVTQRQITVAVPAGATTGMVSVTSPYGTSTSISSFTIQNSTGPVITSVTPTRLDQGGVITIAGNGFAPTAIDNKVMINGRFAAVASASTTNISALVPAIGSGKVAVTTPDGLGVGSVDVAVPPLPYLASDIGAITRTTLGNSGSMNMTAAGQFGMLLFDADKSDRVSIQVNESTFSNGQTYLFGPDGAQVGGVTGLSSGSFGDTQTLTLAGTYTLLAAPVAETGSVAITPFLVPRDATKTIAANSTPVPLTTTVPGQNMKLTFTGVAGARVALRGQFDSALQSGFRPLTMLQPDGATQLYYNPAFNFPDSFTDTLVLPVAGTYTILFDPNAAAVGTATFTLYSVPADATATITANASPVPLTTTVPGQNMKLSFTGAAGARIALRGQFDNALQSGNRPLTILQPDGTTQLYYNASFNFSDSFTNAIVLPITGTYTIIFDPNLISVGTATFTLYSVPTDAVGTIAANATPVSLTTTTPGQNMKLSFTGTTGARVALRGQFDNALQSGRSPIAIVQPDGTTQIYLNGIFNYADNFTDTLILPVSGTYTIFMDPNAVTFGTATFTLYTVQPDATATIAANATPVSLTTTTPGQNMKLSFTGTAGRRVSLRAQFDSSLQSGCRPLTILQPNGTTQVYYNGCFNSADNFTDVLILLIAGTYTIFFDPEATAVGTGTFTLSTVPADAASTITPGGGSVSLSVTQPGQNGELSFSGTQGARVSLLSQFDTALASGCSSISMLQPDGSTELYRYRLCGASNFSAVLPAPLAISTTVPTLPVTGVYKIKLNPEGQIKGTSTFTLYDVPDDIAKNRTINQAAINSTTTVPGQAIRIRFSGQSSQNVVIDVGVVSTTPASPCYRITLLQPDGTTVLRGDQSCSGGYSSGVMSLPIAGVYTIVVSPGDLAVGTFSVRVSTP